MDSCLTNGGIERPEDVSVCLRRTSADAVDKALKLDGELTLTLLMKSHRRMWGRSVVLVTHA